MKHLHGIIYALAGFGLWVFADTLMKLAGEAALPPYEVVGCLGLVASSSLFAFYAPQGKVRELWPKRPRIQILRALMAFGCVMSNAYALNHLPLTVFYVIAFTSPILIAVLASMFLHEKLNLPKIAAILAGFTGVVIAIDPWGNLDGGDWIGYAAVGSAVVFFAVATIILRVKSKSETPHSMMFITGIVEAVLGCGVMLWHAVPIAPLVLLILVAMGIINVGGNICNAIALREMPATTVEQYHYTQILTGALLGFVIWHDIPTLYTLLGGTIIIASGLYVAASTHKEAMAARALQGLKQEV